jgi:hypothetical protein
MLLQNIVMGVLIGTVFLQIGTSQSSTTRRQPVLFFCVINQGIFSALVTINTFPAERVLTLRERAAGVQAATAVQLPARGHIHMCHVTCPACAALQAPLLVQGYWPGVLSATRSAESRQGY